MANVTIVPSNSSTRKLTPHIPSCAGCRYADQRDDRNPQSIHEDLPVMTNMIIYK